jgi:hypothetical protein
MHPEILVLPLQACAVLIGPRHSLTQVTGAVPIDVSFFGSMIRECLARDPAPWRFRSAAIVWGVESFDPRQGAEQRLHDQIARMIETGRLSACFLPLHRDDLPGLGHAGPLRIHQLGGGPDTQGAAPSQASAPPPPPQRTAPRSAAEIQKDFEDEDAQVAVLRAAAKDGTPFCEQCARAALRAARAAA